MVGALATYLPSWTFWKHCLRPRREPEASELPGQKCKGRGFMSKKLTSLFLLGYGIAVLAGPMFAWAQEESPTAAAPAVRQADPSGASTGNAADVPAATPGQPTLGELAEAVGHNKVAINMVWTLLAGFLVMFMQAGFALV